MDGDHVRRGECMDAGPTPDTLPLADHPVFSQVIVRAREFADCVRAYVPQAGGGEDERYRWQLLEPHVLPELTGLAMALHASFWRNIYVPGRPGAFMSDLLSALGPDPSPEPAPFALIFQDILSKSFYITRYDYAFNLKRLFRLFYGMIHSWGWMMSTSDLPEGQILLPNVGAGVGEDDLRSFDEALSRLAGPPADRRAHPGDGRGLAGRSPGRRGRSSRPRPIPLVDFAEEFLARYRSRAKSPRSLYKVRQALSMVMALPGTGTTADLTPAIVLRCVDEMMGRRLCKITIMDILGDLGTACNYAVRRGYLASNPVDPDARYLPHGYDEARPPEAVDAPTQAEVTRLLLLLSGRAAGSWEGHRLYSLAALIAMAGPPGLRIRQALRLRIADLDLDAGRVVVSGCAAAERSRAMPPKLVEVLRSWLPRAASAEWAFPGTLLRGPWNDGPLGKRPIDQVKAAGRDAGVDNLTFERLRAFRDATIGAGRVELGAAFLEAPAIVPTHDGPKPGRPGVKRRAEGGERGSPPLLELAGVDERPVVRGIRLGRPLSRREFDILQAMIELGCLRGERFTEAQIAKRSGYTNPVRTLFKLRLAAPWMTVLDFPGPHGRGRGYGFKST